MNGNKLAAKLAAIQAELGAVEKTGHVSFGNTRFDYHSSEDITTALRGRLGSAGIATGIEFVDVQYADIEGADRKGNPSITHVVRLHMRVTFIDSETGEKWSTDGIGEGHDTGDKASYKAQTGAFKYALRNAFLMSTQDDPEATTTDGEDTSPQRAKVGRQAPGRTPNPSKGDTLDAQPRPPQPQRAQGRQQQTPRKGSQPKPEVPKEAKEIFNLARAAVGDEEAAKWCKMLAGKRGVTSLARVPGSLLAGKLQELEAMSLEERSDYILNAIHAGSSTEHAPSPTTQPTARKSGVTDEAPTDGRGAKDGATLPHERDIPGIGGRR